MAAVAIAVGLFWGYRNFTATTGGFVGSASATHHTCGSAIGVYFLDQYAENIEETFLRPRCFSSAKNRVIDVGLLGVVAGIAIITGLIRRGAPRRRSIDVLLPLPTPTDLGRSRMSQEADVDDTTTE